MKAQREEGGGRRLLGDNTGGGAVMLWPISFQCIGVWISSRSHIYIAEHMHAHFRLAQNSTYVGRFGEQLV
jgi:hypothetical protein